MRIRSEDPLGGPLAAGALAARRALDGSPDATDRDAAKRLSRFTYGADR